jgi:hypothetical protein
VSSDGQLLVGRCHDRQLHIYSAGGNYVTSVKLLDGHTLTDAVWTRRCNIVYTGSDSNKVVLLTQRGNVISQTTISCPYRLSISTDGAIYLTVTDCSTGVVYTNCSAGVYQSTDDGVTWCHVFKVADGWEFWQIVKVSSDSTTQVFWTVDTCIADSRKWILRVYTVDKRRVGNNIITSHDITLPGHVTISLQYSKLTFDGHTNVFITDFENKAVHMWSVSDRQYVCQPVSPQQLVSSPRCIAVDSQRGHVMYVGLNCSTVGVFELK